MSKLPFFIIHGFLLFSIVALGMELDALGGFLFSPRACLSPKILRRNFAFFLCEQGLFGSTPPLFLQWTRWGFGAAPYPFRLKLGRRLSLNGAFFLVGLLMSWAKQLADDPVKRRRLFKGVRSRWLLDLCVLNLAFFFDDHREPALGIRKRLFAKGDRASKSAVTFELTPADIIGILGPDCSEHRAKQYIRTLQCLFLGD